MYVELAEPIWTRKSGWVWYHTRAGSASWEKSKYCDCDPPLGPFYNNSVAGSVNESVPKFSLDRRNNPCIKPFIIIHHIFWF